MSKIQLAAMAAALLVAVPAFSQETQTTTTIQTTPPSSMQQDAMKARQDEMKIIGDKDVHWTLKDRTALLMNAPYLRPRDLWEMNHLFSSITGHEQKVVFEALTNALRFNAGDFYTRQDAMDRYWTERYNRITTTTTTTPSGDMTVTTVQTVPGEGMRAQPIIVGMTPYTNMSGMDVHDLLLKNLDVEDRTTFRTVWNGMTDAQRDAFIDTVRYSKRYYSNRFYSPF